MIFSSQWQAAYQDLLESATKETQIEQAVRALMGLKRPGGHPDLKRVIQSFSWFQVTELVRSSDVTVVQNSALTGLHALNCAVAFLAGGWGGKNYLLWGIDQRAASLQGRERWQSHLQSGSVLVRVTPPEEPFLEQVAELRGLLLSGIPFLPAGHEGRPVTESPIDRLFWQLQSLDTPWAYLVIGIPGEDEFLFVLHQSILQYISALRVQYKMRQDRWQRQTERLEQLLEAQERLLAQALTEGGWGYYAVAMTEPSSITLLESALRQVFAGPNVLPEPFRVRYAGSPAPIGAAHYTFSPATPLAYLTSWPVHEHVGIAVEQRQRFGVVPPAGKKPPFISVGRIVDGERVLAEEVVLSASDFQRHVFVAGITGAGKTTTVKHILQQLVNEGVKILVLEPVKSEYRWLDIPDLRVFSIGKPGEAIPLNPFAFEGVSCSTHLDLLKSLFAAAYVLYPPMPYVLEQALHEVYLDKGWDFASGENWRSRHSRAWPTLSDLVEKVEAVIARSGYGPRLEPELRAALTIRLNNLRLGTKGQVLDVRNSFSLEQLVEKPTIIELEGVGDPEQRAFFLGLLLMRIYEGSVAWGPAESLRLVVVLEEAHRFLEEKRYSSEDFANPQAKAIQTFGDLLAEMRAYGTGFVIAEQSPSRITSFVLKNTATKIVHAIVDMEDRLLMAGNMALNQEESKEFMRLIPGEALFFQQGMERPVKIRVFPKVAERRDTFSPAPVPLSSPLLQTLTNQLMREARFQQTVTRFLFAWLWERQANYPSIVKENRRLALQKIPLSHIGQIEVPALFVEAGRKVLDHIISRMGEVHGWPFDREEKLWREAYEAWRCTIGEREVPAPSETVKDLFTGERIYNTCGACPAPCYYLPFVRLSPWQNLYAELHRLGGLQGYVEEDLLEQAKEVAGKVAPEESPRFRDVMRCLLGYLFARLQVPAPERMEALGRLLDRM